MNPQYIVVEPAFDCPFRTEVIRIVPPQSYDNGLTLLFLHADNLHKESWIPLVRELLVTIFPVKIKDVWLMDYANHGRSATLNRQLLESNEYRNTWTPMDNTRTIHAFLATTTHGVDFTQRKLVVISQSGGSIAMVLLQKQHPEIILSGHILLDAAVLPPGRPSSARLAAHYTKMANLKTDRWINVDKARQELLDKGALRYFAPEVFELFLQHALRPVDKSGEVTLAATRAHDIAIHSSGQELDSSGEALIALCKEDKVPIHLIICPKDELRGLSEEAKVWQSEVIGKTSKGSVQRIEKGGHLFPQVEPILSAHYVRTALLKIWNRGARL